MGGRRIRPGFHPRIDSLIRLKASRMSHQPEFREEEFTDLQQMLRLKWLEAEPRYAPESGTLTQFADTVLDNFIRNQIEFRRAAKRAWWMCQASLDDPVDADDEAGLVGHDSYDREDYFERMETQPESAPDTDDLAERIKISLDSLKPEQREFALRLMTQSITQIAKQLGVHRSTLYDWREQIRRVFRKAGLEEFLEK